MKNAHCQFFYIIVIQYQFLILIFFPGYFTGIIPIYDYLRAKKATLNVLHGYIINWYHNRIKHNKGLCMNNVI